MSVTSVLKALELCDSARVTGEVVANAIKATGINRIEVERVTGERGTTDFVRVFVPGTDGRSKGGSAPTLGIIGRLGGIGARPERIGLVSDADGAVAAIACALKLGRMAVEGDVLPGDVIISTQICPNAPTKPHDPVPFVGSPVDGPTLNREEVRPEMDAILSVVTTRGNRVINVRGFAISPTVKAGWILPVSNDLLNIQQDVTGRFPVVLPISMQDITPITNGLFHVNTILEPSQATDSPVVGVALASEVPVAGSATGGSQWVDIEQAVRFAIEVAKSFTCTKCHFYDESEWEVLSRRYGSMAHLQSEGGPMK